MSEVTACDFTLETEEFLVPVTITTWWIYLLFLYFHWCILVLEVLFTTTWFYQLLFFLFLSTWMIKDTLWIWSSAWWGLLRSLLWDHR